MVVLLDLSEYTYYTGTWTHIPAKCGFFFFHTCLKVAQLDQQIPSFLCTPAHILVLLSETIRRMDVKTRTAQPLNWQDR